MNHGEALNRAADIIEAQGFVKGPQGTAVGPGPKCALGAISQAVGHRVSKWDSGREEHYETYITSTAPAPALAFATYLAKPDAWGTGKPTLSVVWTYNDEHEAEDVVAQLRAAAVIEEAKALESVEA